MNAFNRLITVLVIIVLWLAIVLLAAVPQLALSWASAGLAGLESFLAFLDGLQPTWLYPLMRVGVIVLVTVIALALLWLELRRERTPAVRVQLASGGQAAVTADSVARRLAWHVDQLADVISVQPVVKTRGSGVDVHLDLETAPVVDVPMKTEEVMAVTRDVIEQQMGLQLRNLKVEIRHAPFPETL